MRKLLIWKQGHPDLRQRLIGVAGTKWDARNGDHRAHHAGRGVDRHIGVMVIDDSRKPSARVLAVFLAEHRVPSAPPGLPDLVIFSLCPSGSEKRTDRTRKGTVVAPEFVVAVVAFVQRYDPLVSERFGEGVSLSPKKRWISLSAIATAPFGPEHGPAISGPCLNLTDQLILFTDDARASRAHSDLAPSRVRRLGRRIEELQDFIRKLPPVDRDGRHRLRIDDVPTERSRCRLHDHRRVVFGLVAVTVWLRGLIRTCMGALKEDRTTQLFVVGDFKLRDGDTHELEAVIEIAHFGSAFPALEFLATRSSS